MDSAQPNPATLPNPAGLPGLSPAQAASRLTADGPNALPRAKRRAPLRIVLNVLHEPMLALLLGGGVVYLLLGNRAEALILLAFACLSITITAVQEARTERVLDALRDLTSPRALVIRGGERLRIAGTDVVRGDLIVLAEGDRVPADARLLQAADLPVGGRIPADRRGGAGAQSGGRGGGHRPSGGRGSTAGVFGHADRARSGAG